MVDHSDFHVELVRPPGGGTVVEASGELDIYTSPEFQRCLTNAVERFGPRVIVDLTQVTFLDSSALGALIGAARQSARQVTELLLVCPPGSVSRVVAITGLDRVFTMYATREEALAARLSDSAPRF